MYFALITGLLYGRFSRPRSKIKFAKNAIITPYQDGNAIMFKMVNQRNSTLLDTSVSCILTMAKDEHDPNKGFFNLPLELDHVDFFPLTWTVVHKIDDDSPFKDLNAEDLRKRRAELIVSVRAFDETFAQNIIEKVSFAEDQWLDGVKFARSFEALEDGSIELRIHELDNLEKL